MSLPYEPLRSETSLRLVIIHAGQHDEPVRCKTLQLGAEEQASIQYKALSYCVGPADEQHTIFVDDIEFKGRRNLYHALLHLRTLDDVVRL